MHITAQGPRLRNDLYCVEWDVILYTIPYRETTTTMEAGNRGGSSCRYVACYTDTVGRACNKCAANAV